MLIKFYNRFRNSFQYFQKNVGTAKAIFYIFIDRLPLHKILIFKHHSSCDIIKSNIEIVRYSKYDTIDDRHMQLLIELSETASRRVISKGIQDGIDLWIAEFRGQPAAVQWSRCKEIRENYFFPIQYKDTYLWGWNTKKEFRGNNLCPSILLHIVKTLRIEGQENFYCDCKSWNRSSIKCIEKSGFKIIFCGWRLIFNSNVMFFSLDNGFKFVHK